MAGAGTGRNNGTGGYKLEHRLNLREPSFGMAFSFCRNNFPRSELFTIRVHPTRRSKEQNMRHIEVIDPITRAQNEGIPCPHCKSKSGHYIICPTINRAEVQSRAAKGGA
ncbi:MAG: hypothetical protein JWN45_3075 [Acidobacteriaceae bacterium]|nr:hypothetical protein [Acidobacteriaceae bacterium]